MANQWLRLWHDMPNDPKFQVIAKRAQSSVPVVISVYVHMLVNASLSPERGSLSGWVDEDVAASLGTDENEVERIRTAMNGKLLDGSKKLIGWEKRQVVCEAGAERARVWKLKQKELRERIGTDGNTDKDKDKDKDNIKNDAILIKKVSKPDCVSDLVWNDWLDMRKQKKAKVTQTALDGITKEAIKAGWNLEKALAECCARGWTGFKAEWVEKEKSKGGQGAGRITL